MPVDLTISGAEKLQRVAAGLKQAGAVDLRKGLYGGIQRATKPMKQRVKDVARRDLPKRGGLNEFVASAKLTTKTRGAGKNPGVRISGTKAGHDIRNLDKGRLRHPVFGHKDRWVEQKVPAGFFSKTLEDEAPTVRAELLKVLDGVASDLARR